MNIIGKKTALIFPGQGSQQIGMGNSLANHYEVARDVFTAADQLLGYSITEIMWTGPEGVLNDTLNTQPALFVHSIAVYRVLQQQFEGWKPECVAGHSLGQLSAITASGALSFEDGLRLVAKRGQLMKRAGEINPGGMAAILGLDIPTLDKVCVEASRDGEVVQVANDNCPGQVVISGHKSALERALAGAKAAGAKRALPLAVSIAAHSPLMDSIQQDWNNEVHSVVFGNALIPVIGNVSADTIVRPDDLRAELMMQMQSRVRWTESARKMAATGVDTFLEIGSGSVLCGLMKRIVEGVTCVPLGSEAEIASMVAAD